MRNQRKKAKAAKSKAKNTKRSPNLLDRLPKNRGEYLEKLIELTERAIQNGMPDYLVDQANRLRKELDEWKASNP